MASKSHLCIRKYLLTTCSVPRTAPGPAGVSANRRDQVSTHMNLCWGGHSADGRHGERQGLLSAESACAQKPKRIEEATRQMSQVGRNCDWEGLALEMCLFGLFEEPRPVCLKQNEGCGQNGNWDS